MIKHICTCLFCFIFLYLLHADATALPEPILSSEGGEYYDFAKISFERFEDAKIIVRYTLDNSDVDENSSVYLEPFELRQNTIVRAKSFKENHLPSEEVIHLFNIPNIPQNLTLKTYRDSVYVSWKNPDLWSIRNDDHDYNQIRGYNVFLKKAGSDITDFQLQNTELIQNTYYNFSINESGIYNLYVQAVTQLSFDQQVIHMEFDYEPITPITLTHNIAPIAILLDNDPLIGKNLTNNSQTVEFELKQVNEIEINPKPGIYFEPIIISFGDSDANIYYTFDESSPNENSTRYPNNIPLNKNSELVIQYRGFKEDYLPTEAIIAHYKVTDTARPPLFSIPTGYYFQPFMLQIFSQTAGATIYYTTDGSIPNSLSKIYTNPIMINKHTIVRAIVQKTDWRESKVVRVEYDIIDSQFVYNVVPEKFLTKLLKPFPNPFGEVTNIGFTLEKEDYLEIGIYNILGQKITTLLSERRSAGEHSTEWNGRCDLNQKVTPGVYFCQMITKDYKEIMKIVLTN